MIWIFIGGVVINFLLAVNFAREVNDGIEHDRRASVIAEDSFMSGIFSGMGILAMLVAVLLAVGIL